MKKQTKGNDLVETAIKTIKSKIENFANSHNKTALAKELRLQKNYFHDLPKKKNFTISELMVLSEKFDYDFFEHVNISVNSRAKMTIAQEKPMISVTVQIKDETKSRLILEQFMDENSINSLIKN